MEGGPWVSLPWVKDLWFLRVFLYHMQMASGVMDSFAISTNAENWVQFEPQGMQPNLTCYEK
jgi:hypothetical protein